MVRRAFGVAGAAMVDRADPNVRYVRRGARLRGWLQAGLMSTVGR